MGLGQGLQVIPQSRQGSGHVSGPGRGLGGLRRSLAQSLGQHVELHRHAVHLLGLFLGLLQRLQSFQGLLIAGVLGHFGVRGLQFFQIGRQHLQRLPGLLRIPLRHPGRRGAFLHVPNQQVQLVGYLHLLLELVPFSSKGHQAFQGLVVGRVLGHLGEGLGQLVQIGLQGIQTGEEILLHLAQGFGGKVHGLRGHAFGQQAQLFLGVKQPLLVGLFAAGGLHYAADLRHTGHGLQGFLYRGDAG